MNTMTFDVEDGVGWLRLCRPEKHNPVDADLRSDLMSVLERVRNEPDIRVLVISGTPGVFCAGGNLSVLHQHLDAGPQYWQERIRSGLRCIQDLLSLGRPVIAAIDGPAIGAGFALALATDMVVATPRSRFCMAHLRLGLVPDLGALYLLPRAVGIQRAKELIFSARDIPATEAHDLGLVMELVDSESLETRVREIAASLTRAAPAALAMTKLALNTSLDGDQQSLFSLEAASQAAAFAAPEPRAAIEAILAKRSPPYRGFGKT